MGIFRGKCCFTINVTPIDYSMSSMRSEECGQLTKRRKLLGKNINVNYINNLGKNINVNYINNLGGNCYPGSQIIHEEMKK